MKKIFTVAVLCVSLSAAAQQRVAYWKPVALSGRVEMLPATDLRLGKEVPVTFPALVLDTPITAGSENGDPDNRPETSGIVQLSATGRTYDTIKRLRGSRVAIECHDLFPSATAHHFAPILCTVDRVVTP